jgi:hypothetical protein
MFRNKCFDPGLLKITTSFMPRKKPKKTPQKEEKSTNCKFPGNYVPASTPGCYVVHFNAPWIMGVEVFDPRALGLADDATVPDISVDPTEGTLSVINTSYVHRIFQLTLGHAAITAGGQRLPMGTYRKADGKIMEVITFVLLVKPRHIMDVGKFIL